jgi:translation initiation factor 4E
MAGYFSNHSAPQARFLANSPSNSSSTSTVAGVATTKETSSSSARSAVRQSSKHFSTSLADEREKESSVAGVAGAGGSPSPSVHPLRNTCVSSFEGVFAKTWCSCSCGNRWVFWFRQQRAPGNKITNYEEGIKKIAAFSSVHNLLSCLLLSATMLKGELGRVVLVSLDAPIPSFRTATHNGLPSLPLGYS